MNAIQKHIYFLVIIINFFFSCKKEKDTQPPVITISSPTPHQPFYVNESIPVKGTISDGSVLTAATVSLLNERGVPVMASVPIPVSGSEAEINLKYLLEDIHLETGPYLLSFFASDGTNDGYAFQWVYIYGVPRSLKKIIVTTSTSTQTTISTVDSASATLIPYQSFSGDHLASAANSHAQKFFHCGEATGHFIGLDLNNHSLFLDESPSPLPPAPYFTGFCFADNKCYVAFYNEQIKGYDPTGAIVYNAKLLNGYYAIHLFVNNGQLITEEKQKITGDKKLVCYYPTGVAKQSVALTQEVVSFCEKDDGKLFLFGNRSGQGIIQLYDGLSNNLWDPYPYALAAGTILSAVKLDTDTYLIAHSNGTIYKYVYTTSSITTYLTGYTALQLLKDDVAGMVYVVEKNRISRFEYPGLKPLPVIHSGEDIREISLLYNR